MHCIYKSLGKTRGREEVGDVMSKQQKKSKLQRLMIVSLLFLSTATQAAPSGLAIEESHSNRKVLQSQFVNALEATVQKGINRIPSQQLPHALVDGNVELTIHVLSRLPIGSFGF